MKTARGFEIQYFYDDYSIRCSIQESSSVDPHLWLGVADDSLKIMAKDKAELLESVRNLCKDNPETNEYGWCSVKLPRDALIDNRMHFNRKQAQELAKKLNYFAKHGYLKEEKALDDKRKEDEGK